MSQYIEEINVFGVKYELSETNEAELHKSLRELFSLYENITGKKVPEGYDEDWYEFEEDILEDLEIDYNMKIHNYGNMMVDVKYNPRGLVIDPCDNFDLLKNALNSIGSSRIIKRHSLIKIG